MATDHLELLPEAEVAEAAGELDELLGIVVGIAFPGKTGVAQKLLAGKQRHCRLADYLHLTFG